MYLHLYENDDRALGVTGWMDRTDARIPVWKFVCGKVVAEEWSRDRLAEPGNLFCIKNATVNMLLADILRNMQRGHTALMIASNFDQHSVVSVLNQHTA